MIMFCLVSKTALSVLLYKACTVCLSCSGSARSLTCRERLKELAGIKKKSKTGQQRAEDRAEQLQALPKGARPLGIQHRRQTQDPPGPSGL